MSELKITLTRSLIGFAGNQRRIATALGLGKVGSVVTQNDTPAIRGMINRLTHVVTVEGSAGVISVPPPRPRRKKKHGPHHATGVDR